MSFKGFLFDIKKLILHYFRLNNFDDIMIVIAVFQVFFLNINKMLRIFWKKRICNYILWHYGPLPVYKTQGK